MKGDERKSESLLVKLLDPSLADEEKGAWR